MRRVDHRDYRACAHIPLKGLKAQLTTVGRRALVFQATQKNLRLRHKGQLLFLINECLSRGDLKRRVHHRNYCAYAHRLLKRLKVQLTTVLIGALVFLETQKNFRLRRTESNYFSHQRKRFSR